MPAAKPQHLQVRKRWKNQHMKLHNLWWSLGMHTIGCHHSSSPAGNSVFLHQTAGQAVFDSQKQKQKLLYVSIYGHILYILSHISTGIWVWIDQLRNAAVFVSLPLFCCACCSLTMLYRG